ncbi:MAG: response regulator transcription factor [Candidatus Omnitrophica bacterium]|nr:response regulator transcription factor [Candidatus Omnitrophota bacterium]
MYRVLFITDQAEERKLLKSCLLEQGHTVAMVPSRQLLSADFASPKADVILMDLEDVQTEFQHLFRVVRKDRVLKTLPLVALVTEEQLGHLNYSDGVDDYLTLPLTDKRLLERLRFLMWKNSRVEGTNGLKIGALTVNFDSYDVHVHGQRVVLTHKEFELLKFLATHPGRVFTREALLDQVWGYESYAGTRTVDVHIRRLRAKIERRGERYIETLRHVGYKFAAQA